MASERNSGGTDLIDVLDRVLDKGVALDAWVRRLPTGIDLLVDRTRVIVASIDTHLRYTDPGGMTDRVDPEDDEPPAMAGDRSPLRPVRPTLSAGASAFLPSGEETVS